MVATKEDLEKAGYLYRRALVHLEEQWPEKLAALLKSGRLLDALDDAVVAYIRACERVEKANPKLQQWEIDALVTENTLAPENPKYDPLEAKPLPLKVQKLLDQFLKKTGLGTE